MKVMKCTILVFLPYTWFVEPVINSREEDFQRNLAFSPYDHTLAQQFVHQG